MSNKYLILLIFLICLSSSQILKPIMLLPTQTTQNIRGDYAFIFQTDTHIPHSGSISIIFPFEFDARILTQHKGCYFASGSQSLQLVPCKISRREFKIQTGTIKTGNLTVLLKNILNPIETQLSSHFNVKTYFRDVIITQNLQFGKIPFTKPPMISSNPGKVYNFQNILVQQGSTWVFKFTLDGTYASNSTIRFFFPEGFISNKIQCNISGIIDYEMKTRVFPQLNIYDCLNVKASLTGSQNIILSGIVNPSYSMQMEGLKVQIIQPNNLVVQEIIDIDNQPEIKAKDMNVSMTIPNNFRNNTITYIFQINMDSDLYPGDYFQLTFDGNWTFFIQDSRFIEGIQSNYLHTAKMTSQYNYPTNSKLFIRNFSSVPKQSQTAFYVSLRTPLISNNYNLQILAYRSNNKIVQRFSRILQINQTTGYIRQMKLHPMNQAVKLPVGQTGPLEITLALRNNLPKTNVLTFGKIIIDISPHIPLPDININGIPKCYFYGDIPAKNCSYTFDTNVSPTKTHIIAYTPVDFNFQSSQVPFMVTTQGYINEDEQGLTIDTLVKRYHFHVQFYTDYRTQPIPTQVIFTDWVADPISLTDFTCNQITNVHDQDNHLKCQFTTKNQVLNQGHIHIFRIQFTSSGGWYQALGYSTNQVYPDYPCLVYGPNVVAVPYPKCDLYTHQSGPYAAQNYRGYINIYGLQTIPGNSLITIQIPKVRRQYHYYPLGASLALSILEDTYGYQTQYLKLYYQSISLQNTGYNGVNNYNLESVSYTLTNNIINKVTDITLNSYNLGQTAVSYVILQVDQTQFPDIGRSQGITCGTHTCSKFNKPIQYFILYPSSTLGLTASLTFPSITTPSIAGTYEFRIRVYKNYNLIKKSKFDVVIQPQTLAAPTYSFAVSQTITQMYPNTNHYYTVSWVTKNELPESTGYIEIFFNDYFTLSSKYCHLTTDVIAYDAKQIQCEVWQGSNKVILSYMNKIIGGNTFSLTVEMSTTYTTASFTPTVSIYTYASTGIMVDRIINSPFTTGAITNTNLNTLTSFNVIQPYKISKTIQKGYFGDLIVTYDPYNSNVVTSSGTYLVLTFTNQFYPYSNVQNLPLSCIINNIRFPCSYTLAPFTVRITDITNKISTGINTINITTEYLQRNGIHFPSNQGRYLLKVKGYYSNNAIIQTGEQFVDIKPDKVNYFNVTYVHRQANRHNIFIAEFQNGLNTISSYNDITSASRIYVGFPTAQTDGTTAVFSKNLGYSNGTIIPCYFQTGADYATPLAGKQLACRLRKSYDLPVPAYIQIINFDTILPNMKLKIFMGKILNPVSKQIDLNFNLKINNFNSITKQQSPQYQNDYNLFIDMLDDSTISVLQSNSSTQMFQPGTQVGDANKYINHIPYTTRASGFKQNDWFIVVMNSEFLVNNNVINCLNNFYKRCIVFKQINWVAIHINNGTLIPFYINITQMPISISRVDTSYQCFTFLSQRWSQTITYTITAASRWMELRGQITNFNLQVLGSQNKLNIGQKNVQVMISFTVTHKVNKKGTIQIKFPSNSTSVPSIRPHCRSAVTMGSDLKGFNTGKPSINFQGQVGCLVQNDYSWIITSFDQLPANSNVKIMGIIDLPNTLTSSLGTGYIITYSNQHLTNVYDNGKIIDYLSTNFLLQVENKTWSLDNQVTLTRSQPLRINHKGKLQFKYQGISAINSRGSTYPGAIYVNLWKQTILGNSGGFNGPVSNIVCIVYNQNTLQRHPCQVTQVDDATRFYSYKLQFYQSLPANTPFIIAITTQNGDSNEGIRFPTIVGTYKIQIQVDYATNDSNQVSKAIFIQVYGPKFNVLNLVSTVSIPDENNLLLFEIIPSFSVNSGDNRLVIEIPTISNENIQLFAQDLGMGYRNYDDLVFDIYDSSISSMKCKFYIGDKSNNQPVRILCNQFSLSPLTNSHYIRFGFWVKNPLVTIGLAVPIQVYFEQITTNRKIMWQMLQAGIKVIPTTVSPINDFGNFQVSSLFRQLDGVDFKFTTRNTKTLINGDLYILKFNFDLRKNNKFLSSFKYPATTSANSGNTIFLRNCRTILIEIGLASLSNVASGSLVQNVLINAIFYNPSIKLSTTQSQITGYAYYKQNQGCQKVIHKDTFPTTLVPNQIALPIFTMTPVNNNLRKGQYEDYTFSFRMGSSTALDISLVKRISIQFPLFTSVDFKFMGTTCIETGSSNIQIMKCYMDASTLTIWIQPYIKSTYQNNHNLIIRTMGKAIMNPQTTASVDMKQFVIKYYTWADGVSTPAIFATSDDYVFMKQDDTIIPSSVLTFTSTSYTHHDYVQISQQLYTNQFLIANTDLNTMKNRVPLQFKLKTTTVFSNLDGSINYHQIKIKYNDYYQIPNINTFSKDLLRYIPVCELNGYRIKQCTIQSSTHISMRFQQSISSGEQISVRFSILDPVDSQNDGFRLKVLTYPIITIPVYITPYVSGALTTYLIQSQPFHTFYRSSGTYPSLGIVSASVKMGTQVFGKMNYLDFSLSFSRSDINGLVLQIPLVKNDGSFVYNDPTLLNLPSGAEYPCSVGQGLDVYCYYEKGDTTVYGRPTRIYISRFIIQSGNTLSFRMLFTNPDIVGVFTTFVFKAYTGTIPNSKLMGQEFVGEYYIHDSFKTFSNLNYYSTSTCSVQQNKVLYSQQTQMRFYINNHLENGGYVMLEWTLHNPTNGEVSTYVPYQNSNDSDYLWINYAHNNRKLYIVKKFTVFWNATNQIYHQFGYLRNKHHFVNDAVVYYFQFPVLNKYACTVSQTYYNGIADATAYGGISIQYVDIQDRSANAWSYQFMSISMGTTSPATMLLNSNDPGDLIVVVNILTNRPYQDISSTANQCSLQDGITNTNPLRPVTCTIDRTNNRIIFKNVNKFTGQYLKFYYYAQTPTSLSNHQVQIIVYASQQSFTQGKWHVFQDTSDSSFNMDTLWFASHGTYNSTTQPSVVSNAGQIILTHDVDNGWVKITYLSGNTITFQARKGSTTWNSPVDVYKMTFRFYVQRLTFSSGCTVNSRTISKHNEYCSGNNGNVVTIGYSFYATDNSQDWPNWVAGSSYIFTLTFTSITGQTNADYLFASMVYTWEVSQYHSGDCARCGSYDCNHHPCSCTCSCSCGCNQWGWSCNGCCNGCCSTCHDTCCYSCRRYYTWDSQFLTGKTTPYYSTKDPVTSYSGSTLTTQRGRQTQLTVQFNNFQLNVGPTYNNYILLQLNESPVYTNNNPFPYTLSTQLAAYIDCKCIVYTGTLTLSSTTVYTNTKCVRYIMSGMTPSFSINIDVTTGNNMKCWFPGFLMPNSAANDRVNIDMLIESNNYHHTHIPRAYWAKYSIYNHININMRSQVGLGLASASENSIWSVGSVGDSREYELNISYSVTWYPTIYISAYAPRPTSQYCDQSAQFTQCRIYDTFTNRRYFVVARSSDYTSIVRLNGTTYYPPSQDGLSSFFNTLIFWTDSNNNYYTASHTNDRLSSPTNIPSILSPTSSTNTIQSTLYGSTLMTYKSSYVISVNMNGKTIYAKSTNYGAYRNSYIKISFSGFTSIYGCGVTLRNRARSLQSPFLCEVSGLIINIYARNDIVMTDYMYVTFNTDSNPSTGSYTLELFDKTVDSSDYSRTVVTSSSFSRPQSSYTKLPRSNIQWRKPVYKQLRTTSGPIRFTIKNNYEYVSQYDETTNTQLTTTDAIIVYIPSGFSISDNYICYVKQYLPGKKSLYKQMQLPCGFFNHNSDTRVYIKPIFSYTIKPTYFYQISVYRHVSGQTMHITIPTADVYSMQIVTNKVLNSYSTSTIAMYDYFDKYLYKATSPITLNQIYYLNKQAGSVNSLYLSFTINVAGTAWGYFEFQFDSLGLSSFKIQNGDQIQCYLSGEFTSISGKILNSRCYGYTNGIDNDSPLIIRVFGMNNWLISTNFKLAFDNFGNPSLQTLFLVPINIKFRYFDSTTNRLYYEYLPSVYLSDSKDYGSSTAIPGTLTQTNANRGGSNTQYISIGWPYTSNYNDYSQKVVLKLEGGITCCQSFVNLDLRDNLVSYDLLWNNTKLNMSVYRTPTRSINTGVNLQIVGVVNPYPYQKQTYQLLKKIQIIFYSSFKTSHLKKVDQFNYSQYSQLSQFNILSSPSSTDLTRSFSFHNNYAMTYDFTYRSSLNSFNNRQLSYTILTFTSGVTNIQWAHGRYQDSPYYVNNMLHVIIGKNPSNQYYLNISGMSDSIFSVSYDWYIRIRMYCNANTIGYSSITYALNGEVQFSNSQTHYVYDNNYRSSGLLPTYFSLRQQKYFKNFYQLQRIPIYAKSGSTIPSLKFRFKTPYNITNQQLIDFIIDPSTDMIPTNSPLSLYCLIHKTLDTKTSSGISRWSQCSFNTNKYTIKNPIGNLLENTQYTLTIVQRNQTTTLFNMPIEPKRVQVSLIYNSQLNLRYGDVYQLDYQGRMSQFSITHGSLVRGWDNMIGLRFTPGYQVNSSASIQTVIQLQIFSRYYDQCGNAISLFNNQGQHFSSGTYYSHFSSPSILDSNTRLKCGQYSKSYSPIKLSTTDYGFMYTNINYYFRYPLILNPSGLDIPFIYKFRLLMYKSSQHYPVIVSSYEYQGLEDTANSAGSSSQTGWLIKTSNNNQDNLVLKFQWPNYNMPIGHQTWLKWKNNQIQAFTSVSTMLSTTTLNYDYQFYPNINLCVYIKKTQTDDRIVDIGTFPTSIDRRHYKLNWVHMIESKTTRQVMSSTYLSNLLAARSSWTTSQLSKVSGLSSYNSQGIFKVQFKTSLVYLPQGSYILISFSTPFNIMDEYCKQMSGFTRGSQTGSNLVCKRFSATQIIISGYAQISVGSALSIDVYLRHSVTCCSFSTYATVSVYSQDDKMIISSNTATTSYTLNTGGSTTFKLQNVMRYDMMKDTARELYIQFKLSTYTLAVGQYVQIDFGDWVLDQSDTAGQIISKYKVGSNRYWLPALLTRVDPLLNKYRFSVYSNIPTYSMSVSNTITLLIDNINPNEYNGFMIGNTQYNNLKITAHQSNNNIIQHQYASVWVQPYEHVSLDVQTALNYINAVSIYEFSVTPNVSALVGDYILIEFRTNDGLNQLFSTTLGKAIPMNDSLEISCREFDKDNKKISDNNIRCLLFKGDNTLTPSIPTTIRIKIQKNINVNTLLKFNILSLANPGVSNYPVGITFKYMNKCLSNDRNRLCTYYKSTKYIYFDPVPASIPTLDTNTNYGSLTFFPTIVSATSSQHTVSASISLAVGDYVKIKYYPQVTVPQVCSLKINNGVCYSYPLQNTIIIKNSIQQSGSYSFTLTGMTNLYQYTGNKISTQIWGSSTKRLINIFQTQYTVSTIVTDPISTQPLSILFQPTLTTNYHLSYQFGNIAKVTISYILQNNKIQMIELIAPTHISLVNNYCNATMTSSVTQAKPYPYRFKCTISGSSVLRITMQSDFPKWQPDFINRNIIIYLKYTIQQALLGQNCADWVARAYTHPSQNSNNYVVSQARGKFYVINYMSPYIYKIDFFTLSFMKRICLTDQQCMFYGYLLPSTDKNLFEISYIDFTIPRQFKYSNLIDYSSCDMQQQNNDYNPITLCRASRNNSIIALRFKPTSYNHNYKLLKIDHNDVSRLFTAPEYPGSHYQMKVDLYTNGHKLIESQMVNLTTVYGALLSYNDIDIKIPKDQLTKGIFQFTFKVGSKDIEPAYESSQSNTITSSIQLIFSNSFQYDLGTNKKQGQQIACLPVAGLRVKTIGKLTCRIYPSVSSITNPIIIVKGYDKIYANQIVTLLISGLKSLKQGVNEYIKIGVSYTYYDYGNVKGYLYQPTGKVVGGTSAISSTLKNIGITLTQTSTNYVGQLVSYYFTCTLTSGFLQIKPTDYIAIQFPQHAFEGRFSMNQKSKCSLSTNQICLSFGLSNIIYFKPSTLITSTSLIFSITNMINTAYFFDYKSILLKVFTVVDGKIDSQGLGNILKLSKPSMNISGLVTKIDSIYGGQSGINYYIDFKLGTYLPQYGKISIMFPKSYTSLFTLHSVCNFTVSTIQKLSSVKNILVTYCQIVGDYQIIISPNGILMDKSFTYQITISNITNPNKNISSQRFTIQSYYSSDIYNRQVISSNTFSSPLINILSIKSCQFDLSIQSTNQYLSSVYSISLICPSYIKQASKLQIVLPWKLAASIKKYVCTSETSSLYSYDCGINNQFINNKETSFLEIYLREHVPQKLILIKGQITNGVKGVYTLQSIISFKGFTYLTGISNRISIQQSTLIDLSRTQIQIQNYPYNRDYISIYTFKIKNPKLKANSLRIQLPSSIKYNSNSLQCRLQNNILSNITKDYFNLLNRLNTTELSCEINAQSLLVKDLANVLLALKQDDFLYLDVFGIKNSEISVYNQQFKFIFMNITDNTGTIIGKTNKLLSYKVSPSPNSLQIDTIALQNKKHQVLNKYTFTMSTIANNNLIINQKSTIGIRILFPVQYLPIWSTIPLPSTIKLTLGSTAYSSTEISMIQGQLMARWNITIQNTFNTISLQFIFRNPDIPINCSGVDPIFIISLFDFKLNSILAETIGNNVNCLDINDRLYWVKISGNSQIMSGNYSTYTIQIQKPAKLLKIKPITTSLAIKFIPNQIIFSDYKDTIKYFNIVSSPAFKGQYAIRFQKVQLSPSNSFYKDIQDEKVTLIQPINSFMIDFQQLNVKSIGQPIQTFVNIEVPSTVSFALIHTNNCSSSYKIMPENRIIIAAGVSQVSYSIQYTGSVIPYMCMIKFQISSLTNINYALKSNILYISGSPSIQKSSILRPMRLILSKTPQNSKNVGQAILMNNNTNAKTLKPIVYEVKQKQINANSIQLQATVSQQGFIYYSVMQMGTQQQKITQKMIYDNKISTGVFYNKTRVILNLIGDVNIVVQFSVSQLQSNKKYLLATYLNCSIGISQIKFKQIQTGKSSNGAGIKISFNNIVTNSSILQSLSTVLRIQQSRLSIFTIQQVQTNLSVLYQNSVMNQRRYIYEILLGPNRKNDSIKPIQTFRNFISSKDTLQKKMKQLVPSMDMTYTMTCYQIILSKPKIRNNLQIQQLTNQNVKVSVQFWQSAIVYGVIIPYNKNQTSLLSKQISQGLNRQNILLNQAHKVKINTDSKGYAQLNFKLLSAEKQYEIYVTAESVLPYEPRSRLDDNQILKKKVKTMTNLNVQNAQQKIIQRLHQEKNSGLAEAVRQHVLSVQQKKSLKEKVTRIRKRK